jgi:membrane-bound metal-dependent hydrolase YbcI (DUF457 family)
MTRQGHTAAAAIIAVAVLYVSTAQPALLLATGLLAGSNAPDWSERVFMVQHRTWTHWPGWWAGLVVVGLAGMLVWPVSAFVAGFGMGGLLHLGLDVGTHMGVPLKWPPDGRRRFSLHLYQTGARGREAAILLALAFKNV